MRKRILGIAPLVLLALGSVACSHTVKVQANGDSEATVTINQHLKFRLKGPIKVPPGIPQIGGIEVGEGAEILVDIPAGTEIKMKDKVNIGQKAASRGVDDRTNVALLDAEVLPGSTYTWTIPDLFGEAEAVVPVTGFVTVAGKEGAILADGQGGYVLDSSLLEHFQYQVSGPPAVWQAPFDTPYGKVEGTGTIETTTGMVWESFGDASAIAGSAVEGSESKDGTEYKYGYRGTFPVRLRAGDGDAYGATTVFGAFNLE